MMSGEDKLTQKVNMANNRGAGIVLWNGNGFGEGIFVFTYNSSYGATAKLLVKRVSNDSITPHFYYDGNRTVAIKTSETWSSWVIIASNAALPPNSTIDSDLTGFTEITIQQ